MRTSPPPAPQNPAPVVAPSSMPQVPAGTPTAVQGLDGLAGQLRALETQLAGLRVQQRDLRSQMRRGGPVDRADVAAQLAGVDAQIASVNAQMAAVRADVAARVGIPTAPTVPPFARRGIDGDDVTAIFIVFMLAVLMPISLGITRRLWRRTPKASEPRIDDVVAPRLERLEQAVDAVAIEIERISESQRFVTRLLAERPRPVASASPAAAVPEPAAEKPVLALGAGPMESVRIPEREAVRQVVTPH